MTAFNRDEDISPSRPDSRKQCPCGEYHPENCPEPEEDYVDDGSIYSPGTSRADLWAQEARETLVPADVIQEPLTFRERDYPVPDFEETCIHCGVNALDHTDFIMGVPHEILLPSEDERISFNYASSITPLGWMASTGAIRGEEFVLCASGHVEYYVVCFSVKQDRAAYGERWSWTCHKVGGGWACDEDYMREIST